MRHEVDLTSLRPLTRHLAEMQTAILAQGLRVFEGDVVRFLLLSVVARETLGTAGDRALSINALAQSVGEPFETVRRHVNALLERGMCERRAGGVAIARLSPDQAIMPIMLVAHDALVRFVDRCRSDPDFAIPPGGGVGLPLVVLVQAAIDLMLAAVANNRPTHGSAVDLVLFSTVLHGNLRGGSRGQGSPAAIPPSAGDFLRPVPLASVARVLSMPETTVRRRAAEMASAGGPLERTAKGVIVSRSWLGTAAARLATERSYSEVGRILRRRALAPFPFDDPSTAYIVGPPEISFDR